MRFEEALAAGESMFGRERRVAQPHPWKERTMSIGKRDAQTGLHFVDRGDRRLIRRRIRRRSFAGGRFLHVADDRSQRTADNKTGRCARNCGRGGTSDNRSVHQSHVAVSPTADLVAPCTPIGPGQVRRERVAK